MRFTLAIAAAVVALVVNAAPVENEKNDTEKKTNTLRLKDFPKLDPKASEMMLNQSKAWSIACTNYAVSTQTYVYDIWTSPIYLGLRVPSSNCTVYNEANDTITDVTQQVMDTNFNAALKDFLSKNQDNGDLTQGVPMMKDDGKAQGGDKMQGGDMMQGSDVWMQ